MNIAAPETKTQDDEFLFEMADIYRRLSELHRKMVELPEYEEGEEFWKNDPLLKCLEKMTEVALLIDTHTLEGCIAKMMIADCDWDVDGISKYPSSRLEGAAMKQAMEIVSEKL